MLLPSVWGIEQFDEEINLKNKIAWLMYRPSNKVQTQGLYCNKNEAKYGNLVKATKTKNKQNSTQICEYYAFFTHTSIIESLR
jgi:hypothetical protein